MSRSMEISDIDTDYGRLLVSYVKALATTEACAADPSVVVALAADLADETERLLFHRFVQRETKFRAAQEDRQLEAKARAEANPVTWTVPEDSPSSRSGHHWFDEEREALMQAYNNLETPHKIAARHRRSAQSICLQLCNLGILRSTHEGYLDATTGDRWA